MKLKKEYFKAKMIDDLYSTLINHYAIDENISVELSEKFYGGDSLKQLHNRIAGKIVTIVKYQYKNSEPDYFEEIDNNWVIFEECFEVV